MPAPTETHLGQKIRQNIFPARGTLHIRKVATLKDGLCEHLCQVTLISRRGARVLTGYEPAQASEVELVINPQARSICKIYSASSPWLDLLFQERVNTGELLRKVTTEDRARNRYPARLSIGVHLNGPARTLRVDLEDISREGAKLNGLPVIDVGSTITVQLGTRLTRSARVCWCLSGSAGVQFATPI